MDESLAFLKTIFLAIIIILLLVIVVYLDKFSEKNTYNYDVNKDGIVNSKDYVLIKEYIMEVE